MFNKQPVLNSSHNGEKTVIVRSEQMNYLLIQCSMLKKITCRFTEINSKYWKHLFPRLYVNISIRCKNGTDKSQFWIIYSLERQAEILHLSTIKRAKFKADPSFLKGCPKTVGDTTIQYQSHCNFHKHCSFSFFNLWSIPHKIQHRALLLIIKHTFLCYRYLKLTIHNLSKITNYCRPFR